MSYSVTPGCALLQAAGEGAAEGKTGRMLVPKPLDADDEADFNPDDDSDDDDVRHLYTLL